MTTKLDDVPLITEEEAQRQGPTKEARMVLPSEGKEAERVLSSIGSTRRCGDCKYFNYNLGQAEIKRTEIFTAMFREMEHRPEWYGDTTKYGLCDMSKGELMTHMLAPARVPKSYVDSSTPYEHQDETVPCPSWTPKNPDTYQPYEDKWTKEAEKRGIK